ncbi:MAG TPA: class I SAM-dependent methyltransferase [Methanolinea sp.]|nr:class I SAM-dependent methyltransferase [Methanolinea sp.]
MSNNIDFEKLERQYHDTESQDFKKIKLVDSFMQPSDALLDIGSGEGSFLELTKPKFRFIYSIEIDPFALKLLKEKFSSDTKIILIPKTVTDFLKENPDLSFDYITCLDVLEHIPLSDCQMVIEKLFRLLKPEGLLIISVPGIFEKIRIFLGKSPTHLHSHSSYGWAKILEKSGFSIMNIQTVEFPILDKYIFRKYFHLFGKCCVIIAKRPGDTIK